MQPAQPIGPPQDPIKRLGWGLCYEERLKADPLYSFPASLLNYDGSPKGPSTRTGGDPDHSCNRSPCARCKRVVPPGARLYSVTCSTFSTMQAVPALAGKGSPLINMIYSLTHLTFPAVPGLDSGPWLALGNALISAGPLVAHTPRPGPWLLS